MNRDTLYSFVIADISEGATLSIPGAGALYRPGPEILDGSWTFPSIEMPD
jgi:hypothetical protein